MHSPLKINLNIWLWQPNRVNDLYLEVCRNMGVIAHHEHEEREDDRTDYIIHCSVTSLEYDAIDTKTNFLSTSDSFPKPQQMWLTTNHSGLFDLI